ncbi:hypothetical protein LCGC14_2694370 [marine sediment metagenome]|uniref:Uncharacterized protein n=1 Tax=marine sediment metagenome TaxID=412755 RepID=A0A0F8ZHM7_9ZZZZ
MGELEKYLDSREPTPSWRRKSNSLKSECREIKSEIEREWNEYRIRQETLHGEEIHGSDVDKLIYYLVKKGIL